MKTKGGMMMDICECFSGYRADRVRDLAKRLSAYWRIWALCSIAVASFSSPPVITMNLDVDTLGKITWSGTG